MITLAETATYDDCYDYCDYDDNDGYFAFCVELSDFVIVAPFEN